MSENDTIDYQIIPEHLILARLEQSEQMREFCIQMWLQNPIFSPFAIEKRRKPNYFYFVIIGLRVLYNFSPTRMVALHPNSGLLSGGSPVFFAHKKVG
jgi:hypothetical protein